MDKNKPIWQFIEELDKAGMKLIEKNDLKGFMKYIDETGNTICGEHPIKLQEKTIIGRCRSVHHLDQNKTQHRVASCKGKDNEQ